MMIIREAQLRALGAEMRRRFIRTEQCRLRQNPLSAKFDESELTHLIDQGIAQAARFGLKRLCDVQRFLDHVLVYGPGFGDDAPTAWAGQVLRTPGVSAAWKLNRLDDCDLFASSA